MVQNEHGKVLDVHGGVDTEYRNVWMYGINRSPAQRWAIRYIDEYRDPEDGEMGTGWGFKVNTDFYLISAMGGRRYLDLVGNASVVKVPNGRTSQKWFFDWKTKTIRSRRTVSYALQIVSNGGGQDMVVAGVNSNWW